jgi:hypothetical protein
VSGKIKIKSRPGNPSFFSVLGLCVYSARTIMVGGYGHYILTH